jgi:predicted alpha-1,6-mannanase (GH76 family)
MWTLPWRQSELSADHIQQRRSYNQGVILGALTELARATSDDSYITTAKTIADAAIANLTDASGVLHDACEPDCGADGSQVRHPKRFGIRRGR